MRFLFVTIQSFECEFYGRVGAELQALGHDVAHITYSRRAARLLRERGADATSILDVLPTYEADDLAAERARIEAQYALPSIREAYWTDPASQGKPEDWAVRRTVAHFRLFEGLLTELRPDVLVPEVGNELPRVVAHLVALDREVRTLFLFYTIFPRPLRLYEDTMHAQIVDPDALRELSAEERDEVERFVREFTTRAEPIRAHRRLRPTTSRLQHAAEYISARAGEDRENGYLRPGHWAATHAAGWGRALAARTLYSKLDPTRPFVYFPLHDTEDYKIKRVIPHFADQAPVIEQVADSLPPGYDLVVKEHPMAIGRTPLQLLRRLARRPNLRLVDPRASTHELLRAAEGVVVIGSTVGLEALLYFKPVLTLGDPFYAGYGVTMDVEPAELHQAVPALLKFRPDRDRILSLLHAAMARCMPGAPVLVDRSDENARVLAASLAANAEAERRAPSRVGVA